MYPPGESRGVKRELFFSAVRLWALREPTGIVVRLLQREKNVAHPPQVRVIRVVARNLPVLSRRGFEDKYTHPARKKIYLNSLLPGKDNGGLSLRAEFTALAHSKYIFAAFTLAHRSVNVYFFLFLKQ